MRVSQVTVDFEKRVNDGNYGSEKASAQYVVVLDDGDDPDEVVRQVIARARGQAIAELKDSETLSVRRALNPPKRICGECGEPLGDEDSYQHAICAEKIRAERDAVYARRQAEREAEFAARPKGPNGEDIEAEQDLGSDVVDDDDDDDEDEPL